MSTSTLDLVRDMLKQIPALPDLLKQAQAPPVTVVADTAYIYNAFYDITLTHLGIDYFLKKGEITKIDGKPDYKEIDQHSSAGSDIVWRNIPLKGEFIAREMVDLHGIDKWGLQVLTEPKIGVNLKREVDERAKAHIFKKIEEYKMGRERSRNGAKGYKTIPDAMVYHFMREYTPDDPIFAEQHQKSDVAADMANAVKLLTQLWAKQQMAPPAPAAEQPQAVTANPIAPTLPQIVDSGFVAPRRRPLEPPEDYARRVEEARVEFEKNPLLEG